MGKPHEDVAAPSNARTDVPTRSLDAHVHALLTDPRLRDAFRATFDGALASCSVGWPRRLARGALAGWIQPADVVVELARSPAREPFELGLVLQVESATRLIDRVLGGPGDSTLPSASGAPSEAECGVLAYAAARLCAAVESPWRIRDVRTCTLATSADHLVLWPLALHTTLGSIDGALLLSPTCADDVQSRHELELIVHDDVGRETLDDLCVGDVFVSDRWTLTDTTDGATGSVTLVTSGTDLRLAAQLARYTVRATGPASSADATELELVLMQHTVPFSELARLAGGEPVPLPPLGSSPALMRHAGRTLARGELVTHRGAIGVRITALFP